MSQTTPVPLAPPAARQQQPAEPLPAASAALPAAAAAQPALAAKGHTVAQSAVAAGPAAEHAEQQRPAHGPSLCPGTPPPLEHPSPERAQPAAQQILFETRCAGRNQAPSHHAGRSAVLVIVSTLWTRHAMLQRQSRRRGPRTRPYLIRFISCRHRRLLLRAVQRAGGGQRGRAAAPGLAAACATGRGSCARHCADCVCLRRRQCPGAGEVAAPPAAPGRAARRGGWGLLRAGTPPHLRTSLARTVTIIQPAMSHSRRLTLRIQAGCGW